MIFEIFKFLYFHPLFLPVRHCIRGWSKINFKNYYVINYLNKNLITHFVWYHEKEKNCDIENLSIDWVLSKEHFYEKSCRKCAPKAIPRAFFNFGKESQNIHCMEEILLKIEIFARRLSKILRKVNFSFSFESSPF